MRALCWLLGHRMSHLCSPVIRETPTHRTYWFTQFCVRCPYQLAPVLRVVRKEKFGAE